MSGLARTRRERWGGAGWAVPAVLRHDNLAAPTYELRRSGGRQLTGAVPAGAAGRQRGQAEERPHLRPLPSGRIPENTTFQCVVRKWSTITGSAACGPRRRQARPPHPVNTGLSLIRSTPGTTRRPTKATDSFFRESVTAEEFPDSMEERPALLGAFGSRTLSSTRRLTVARWTTSCSSSTPPTSCDRQRVTAVSETDEWRVVGIYLIC